jgi:hypothetical protein
VNLYGLSKLRSLALPGLNVDDVALAALRRSLPQCQISAGYDDSGKAR